MRLLNRYIMVLVLALSGITYCGDDQVPMNELHKAKLKLAEAEAFEAENYAKEDYDKAKAEMFKAHDHVSNSDMPAAKTSAIKVQELAQTAAEKAATKAIPDFRQKMQAMRAKAIKANAEEYAPDEFQLGDNHRKEANDLGSDGSNAAEKYKIMKSLKAAYDNYEKAYNVSMAQKPQLENEAKEIQADLNQAAAYGAIKNQAEPYKKATAALKKGKMALKDDDLKTAAPAIAEAKKFTLITMQNSQQAWANFQKDKAAAHVAKAEALLKKFKKDYAESLEIYDDAKYDLNTQEENLAAAKSALTSAEGYYNSQQYDESYKQSQEARNLAKIVIEQLPNIQNKLIEYMNGECPPGMKKDEEGKQCTGTPISANNNTGMENGEGEGTKDPNNTDDYYVDGAGPGPDGDKMTEKPEKPKGWKKYKVKYNPKARDCLWRIASYNYIYSNAKLWPRIYKANKDKIKNPDLIYPGQIFSIPPKYGDLDKLIAEKDEYPQKLQEWYDQQGGQPEKSGDAYNTDDYYVPNVNSSSEVP